MPSNIVYDYEKMSAVVTSINGIAKQYEQAGAQFVTNFTDGITGWEGESKEKMSKLINGDVNTMLTVEIPKYVTALAEVLNANIEQMKKADAEIAASIPDKLG